MGGFRFRGGGFPFGKRAFGGVFLGKIGISAKRTEGRGDFLEALRSDGGEGPIFFGGEGSRKTSEVGRILIYPSLP